MGQLECVEPHQGTPPSNVLSLTGGRSSRMNSAASASVTTRGSGSQTTGAESKGLNPVFSPDRFKG
jgi:hypothetical protein